MVVGRCRWLRLVIASAMHEVGNLNTGYKIQDTRHKIQDTRNKMFKV